MTPTELDLRVRQMHAALGRLATEDLSSVVTRSGTTNDGWNYFSVDFSDGVADTDLMDKAEKLVENIARLKDHLKVWCKEHGIPFDGDSVIDSTTATKLVHDLWNTQKHAVLNTGKYPTRSGVKPRLANMRRSARLSTGGAGPSSVFMTFDRTGKPIVGATGGGKAELVVVGDVVDETGARIGDFGETCEAAVVRWEQALSAVGVPLPKR